MTDYRRFYLPNATWFFTVNLAERHNNHLLIEKIDALRATFRYVKERRAFHINAIVIMPDHLHCIWTLPPDVLIFQHVGICLKVISRVPLIKASGFQKVGISEGSAEYGNGDFGRI
jgi:putative transposase